MPDPGNEVYGVLERPGRIWAIAAVHGEAARLAQLHEALQARLEQGDRLVYLGNYFGRGPDIAGTVDELLAFRRLVLTGTGVEPWDLVYLRGAQEEIWAKLLQLQFAQAPMEVLEWMLGQGGEATLKAYGGSAAEGRRRCGEGVISLTRWTALLRQNMEDRPGHRDFVINLRRYARTDDGRLLFVHAGVDPGRPLSEQGDTFWWGSGYFNMIESPYEGFIRVIRGFDRAHGGRRELPHTVSIDGGCGFGGPLNAACLRPDGAIVDWLEA